MKKTILVLTICTIGVFTTLFAQGSWHSEKTYWPRTLVDSSSANIEMVRDRVVIEPYLSIYNSIIINANIDYSSCSDEKEKAKICRSAAFVFFIGSDTTYADKAKVYLLAAQREAYSSSAQQYTNILYDSEIIEMISFAYDFLKGNNYDFAGDESDVRSQIIDVASSLYYDLVESSPYSTLHLMWDYGYGEEINYGVKFASAMGTAAIVLNTQTSSNPSEQPQEWINYSMTKLNDQFNNWLVDTDGGWAEGPHYQQFSATNFIPFAISHYNFVDGQTENYGGTSLPPVLLDPQFEKNAKWGIKIRQPNGARPDFDDCFLNSYYFNGMLDAYLNDAIFAWDYENSNNPYFVGASSGNIDVEMICTYDNSYNDTDPDYLTQFLPSSGQAIFRSSWSENAAYMCLLGENGIARTGGRTHEHPDNTSFIIYSFGKLLAIDSGYISWNERDKVRYADNHSLILVDGNGPQAAGTYTSNGTDAFIENYFDTNNFDYAEVSTNYQETNFKRCVSFINNSYFIISDFVDGSANHTYDWLLHGNGGGDTGNSFTSTSYGAKYSVDGVDLNFFINSSNNITLSNTVDYNDTGSYDQVGTHTVTKASISGQDELFSAILIPDSSSNAITYTSIDSADFMGGTIEMGNEKFISLVKDDTTTVSANFFDKNISFDSKILTIARLGDSIPRNFFFRDGKKINYESKNLISCSVATNLNLNIYSSYADGFVQNSNSVDFYTGNEPSSVSGATSWSFSNGITSLALSDSSYFQINVTWSLVPPIPTNPEISFSGGNVILNWTGSADLYHIYRSTNPTTNFTEIATSSSTTYTDTGVSGNKYFYYITSE